MAHDDRRNRGHNEEDRHREQTDHRRGRLGDRHAQGLSDDPDHGAERYGAAPSSGYGSDDQGGPMTSDPDGFFSAPGYDPGFGGPRFDRADVGSTGTHGVHPVSSAFGTATPGMAGGGSSARRYALLQRQQQGQDDGGGQHHDPHYSHWRSRQMEQLDRDYEEYRRERQSSFERDFGEWRDRRGRQRQAIGQVREHMEVIGSDDQHVGSVDGVRGDSIILTKSDASAGGIHHFIPCAWIDTVDSRVRLNLSAEQAMARWKDEERSQALFERDQGGRGDDRRD